MGLRVRADRLRKVFSAQHAVGRFGRGGAAKPGEKQKSEVAALDGLSLEVEPGEIFGLLGPNGAGKSTTVGVLTTRVQATSGEGWIGNHNVARDRVAVKRLIGVVPQRPNLDFALTAREILTFHGAYFGLPSHQRSTLADSLLDRFKLTDRAHHLVFGFSGGMMQRLSIARAMMHSPEVLFLDEPSAGLDPQTRLLLWEIVREYNAGGRTIVLTTHNMEEADDLCGRVAIVDHGRVIALGTPAELKRSIPGGYVIRVHFDRRPEGIEQALRTVAGITEVNLRDSVADVYADRGGPLVPAIVAAAVERQIGVTDVKISAPSLENLFLHHTGRSLRD
jgi:ABC-2 type transport system ATP-binding protein